MRATAGLLAFALLTLTLAACSPLPQGNQGDTIDPGMLPTVQPVEIPQTALIRTIPVALYFPNNTKNKIVRTLQRESVIRGRNRVRVVVDAMLGTPADTSLRPIFDLTVRASRVDVCQNLALVDLAIEESVLEEQTLFNGVVAITAALTELREIDYVEFRFNGKQMIPRGLLVNPMSTARYDLEVSWMMHQQLLGQDKPANRQYNILYYKDQSGTYLISEVRATQVSENRIEDIIKALGKVPAGSANIQSAIPSAVSYVDSDMQNGVVKLWLAQPAHEKLENRTKVLMLASIVKSLTTCVTGVNTVNIYLNGILQTRVPVIGDVTGGNLDATLFDDLLGNFITLYFPSVDDAYLLPVVRAVNQGSYSLPESRLKQLLIGPMAYEIDRVQPAFPASVDENALLDVWMLEDEVIVNLSSVEAGDGAGLSSQRLLLYAVVHTLTELDGVRKVQFLVDGQPIEPVSGTIDLTVPLLPNPGLVGQ